MLLNILAILGVIIITIVVLNNLDDILQRIVLIVFASFVYCVILLVLSLQFFDLTVQRIEKEETHLYNITSIRNQNNASGSFSLGFGSIKDGNYYFFFKKVGKNGYQGIKYSIDDSVIIETNKKQPQVCKLEIKEIPNSLIYPEWTAQVKTKYKIYVPKGTIISNFKIQ